MRLGQQRDIERPAARGGVVVADLVGERGLARPGRPLEDVDAAPREAAVQYPVEPRDPARHPLDRLHFAAHAPAPAGPSGSLTTKVEPSPGALSMLIVPPMARTSWLASQRPTPKPPCSRRATARSNR